MKKIFLLLFHLLSVSAFAQSSWLLFFDSGTTSPTPPEAPSLNLVGSVNKIDLTSSAAGDSIRIYRGTSTDPTTWVYSIAVNAAKTDTPLTPGVYYYRGKTYNVSTGLTSSFSTTVYDTVDTNWTTLTSFTQCHIDSEYITNVNNQGFEGSPYTWAILYDNSIEVNSDQPHSGSYSAYCVDDQWNAFIFLQLSLNMTLTDTVKFSAWMFYKPVNGSQANGHLKIGNGNGTPTALILNGYVGLSRTEYFIDSTITDITLISDLSVDAVGDATYFDDISFKMRTAKNAYQKTTTEPVVVKVDEVVLSKTSGTKGYTAAGHYDYSEGVLYIPNNGVCKVTY